MHRIINNDPVNEILWVPSQAVASIRKAPFAEMVLHQMERMAKKARKPKRRSEREDNYIKNAKVLLMERNHLSEEEAHRYIQKSSMDNGTNMVETAQMILTLLFEEG